MINANSFYGCAQKFYLFKVGIFLTLLEQARLNLKLVSIDP
jgi:hypothetical protein